MSDDRRAKIWAVPPEDRAKLAQIIRTSRDKIPAEIDELQRRHAELTEWPEEFDPDVSVVSFGFGHGLGPEAGIVLDVRDVLRNPHHDPRMRLLTGLAEDVAQHVMETPGARELVGDTVRRVMAGETTTVAVGCVGGRHRSVVLAAAIGAELAARGRRVVIEHRDVGKPLLPAQRHGS